MFKNSFCLQGALLALVGASGILGMGVPTYIRAAPQAAGGSSYKLAEKVKLGGAGGWDYLEVDSGTHRVFISRGNHVIVFDPLPEKSSGIFRTHGVFTESRSLQI